MKKVCALTIAVLLLICMPLQAFAVAESPNYSDHFPIYRPGGCYYSDTNALIAAPVISFTATGYGYSFSFTPEQTGIYYTKNYPGPAIVEASDDDYSWGTNAVPFIWENVLYDNYEPVGFLCQAGKTYTFSFSIKLGGSGDHDYSDTHHRLDIYFEDRITNIVLSPQNYEALPYEEFSSLEKNDEPILKFAKIAPSLIMTYADGTTETYRLYQNFFISEKDWEILQRMGDDARYYTPTRKISAQRILLINKCIKNNVQYADFSLLGFNLSIHSSTQCGWVKTDGLWYFYGDDGTAAVGWKQIAGKWYLFNSSGIMLTGWQKVGNHWFYLTSSGAMVTGWRKISGKWYYLNASGEMVTGWIKIAGKWYYCENSGAIIANSSKRIGRKTYRFNRSGVCLNP